MTIKEFIAKLQNLPETKKKIIIFTVVIISALIMGFFWVTSTASKISQLGESLKSVDLPKIDLPKIDLPNIQTNTQVNNTPVPTPTPTPENQTADWKTYTNAKYGFEMKYPPNLSVKENSSNINFIFAKLKGDGLYPFWVSSGNSKQKNIVEILNPKSSDYTEIKNGKSTINNINWNTIEEANIPTEGVGVLSSLLNFYTQKGDFTYILQCVKCNVDLFGDDGANKKSTFDEMVKTFKFTPK